MLPVMADDVAAGFAALMEQARQDSLPEESPERGDAPFGYTTDRDGTVRPKKAPGRPRRSPSLEELRAAKEAEAAGPEGAPPAGDRPPDPGRRPRRQRPHSKGGDDKPKAPAPQFREGVIERGVNQLYRKTGRMVRVADRDIGQALIDITRKDDAEDVTVGEAWEQLARGNPRIRAVLLRLIEGGAWGQLVMCHAPVAMAVFMKDAIRRRLPFPRVAEAFFAPDEDGQAPADGTPLAGLSPEDAGQMMAFAQGIAERLVNGGPRPVFVVPDAADQP